MVGGGIQQTKTCIERLHKNKCQQIKFHLVCSSHRVQGFCVQILKILSGPHEYCPCLITASLPIVLSWLKVIYRWIQGCGCLCARQKASENFAYLWLDFLQLLRIESLLADQTMVSLNAVRHAAISLQIYRVTSQKDIGALNTVLICSRWCGC